MSTYTIDQRSVVNYGDESYPDGAAGAQSNHRSCNGGQPSLIIDDDGTYLAFMQSESSHEAAGGIVVMRRSYDQGRTWDDPCLDAVTVFSGAVVGNSALHCIMSGAWKIRRGPYKGRIICCVSYNDLSGGAEPYTGGIAWSDPGSRTTWHFVQAPRISQYYTITISAFQRMNADRLYITMYTRWNTLGQNGGGGGGAGSFCIYSDDGCTTAPVEFPNSYSWALNGGDFYATTGDAGCIASDPNRVTEYKECYANAMEDANDRGLCLIRSDDSIQIIRKAFTDDQSGRVFGRDWYGLATAFDGFNFPAWCIDAERKVCCATRHITRPNPPDGTDSPILVRSTNTVDADPTLASWDAPMNLWDPQLGIGSAPGCGPRLLPTLDSAGVQHLGCLITWCNPVGMELFTKWRLEYVRLSLNPESAGSYARYDIDHNPQHPSKYLTDGSGNNTVIAWYTIESLRQQGMLHAAVPTRWRNMMGDQRYDLVAGANGFLVFQDGSDLDQSPRLWGGKGVLVNHAGNLNIQVATAVARAQPFGVMIVGDRGALASTFTLWDDGGGTPVAAKWQPNNGGQIFLQAGGVNLFLGPFAGPWSGVFTSLHNGSSSTFRYNGSALAVMSGGPLGSSGPAGFRLGGGSNANFFQGIREVVLFTCTDLTKIAAYETRLIAKHRVLG